MSHEYIKANPNVCFKCGLNKLGTMIREDGGICEHDCDQYDLQGDGRWVWCPKCKSYVDPLNPPDGHQEEKP